MNSKQTSILLIEDNPGDAQLVKIYLKDAAFKYDLLHAETFFEGMEIINKSEIEVILLDLSLPDTSGFKTLSKLLERVNNIPVIVLTGTNNEIVGNQAVKAGAQDFLVKGQFDGKLLGRSIRYSLQRFRTQQRLEDIARELSINEKRIVEAQEMALFGNWEMDIVSNSMIWTDAVYRIFGFQPGSFNPTLSDYLNYVHIEDRELVESFFEKAINDGNLHKSEHRIVIDGQKIKYLSLHAKVYFEELNQKFLLVGGIQDITERKMQDQLIIEQNISRKTSKLKEEVLADMSFHIRTPLTSVVNLLFLLGNTNVSPQQKELLEGLKTSVDDLSMMINNLLNFTVLVSEKVRLDEEEFNIKEFLQSMKKVVIIKSDNARVKLDFVVASELPDKIISDPQKITQLLYNLIDNAILNAGDNGKISISVHFRMREEKKANLFLKISDSGKLMNDEKIREISTADKLLETYADELDDSKRELLGMAIVSKLVKMMSGKLEITSKEGIGNSYDIELPVKIIDRPAHNHPGLAPTAPLKILLVEDHFLNQIATKKVLTSWSDFVTVDIAENGLVGVEKFRAHGYDLVLMDIQMPIMNGLDAAIRIRQNSTVPIIALTANASKQEAEKCVELGMNDYLSKPFKPQDLYEKIMNVLQ